MQDPEFSGFQPQSLFWTFAYLEGLGGDRHCWPVVWFGGGRGVVGGCGCVGGVEGGWGVGVGVSGLVGRGGSVKF